MNNNKWIIYLWTCISFLVLSCNDPLEKPPKDRLYPEVYFNNEAELQLFTNRFYYDNFPSAGTVYSESADLVVKTSLLDEITGLRQIPEEGGGWNFGTLRDINFYLENSHKCEDLNARNHYDGVAYFFRAYFYFEKVKRFGDVPWYDTVMEADDPDLYKARDSRENVVDSILKDLDLAIEKLPSDQDTYQVTRWTALALKSRVCLFEGSFRKYHGLGDYETLLQSCVAASEQFMTESGYQLFTTGATPYRDLFATPEARSEEIILARDYSSGLNMIHNVQNYENSSTMGRPGLNKSMVNTYLMADGTRFTDREGFNTLEFAEECENRDPRLSQTIRTPGYTRMGSNTPVAPNLAYSLTGYHLIKYTMEPQYDEYNSSFNDIPLFRTAEVYLNYAEAKAELGEITQSDIDRSVNLLRDRVNMPHLDMDQANSNPDPYLMSPDTGYPNVSGTNRGTILEIRRERSIELVMEGLRYYDIMRWKAGKRFENSLLGIYVPGAGTYDLNDDGVDDVCFYQGNRPSVNVPLFLEIGVQVQLDEGTKGHILCHGKITRAWQEDRDYLYPIPLRDRILTNGVITQNPGWQDGLSF